MKNNTNGFTSVRAYFMLFSMYLWAPTGFEPAFIYLTREMRIDNVLIRFSANYCTRTAICSMRIFFIKHFHASRMATLPFVYRPIYVLYCETIIITKRRGEDSNLRAPKEANTLAGCRFRPLSHLSE